MSDLRVVRANPKAGFLIVANETVRPGGEMSARALGILVNLMSHSDGRDVSIDKLACEFREGREAIAAAVRELEERRHLVRKKRRVNGEFVHTWTVYEIPVSDAACQDESISLTPRKAAPQEPVPREAAPQEPVGIKKTTSSEDQGEKTSSLPADGGGGAEPEIRDDKPNASHLVDRWIEAWSAARDGARPDPSVINRVKGHCKRIANSRTDDESWKTAWDAAAKAGTEGRFDVVNVLADYRPQQRRKNDIDWDAQTRRAEWMEQRLAEDPTLDRFDLIFEYEQMKSEEDTPQYVTGRVVNGEVSW